VLLSLLPVFIGGDSLGGVFAVILGLPWTALISNVVDGLAPAAAGGMSAGVLIALIGGAINAAIIYFVTRWIVRRTQKV
jgi:hypothetical protein